MDLTEHLARVAGVDETDVQAMARFEDSDRFSELEKNVLRYADGMTATPVEVSDELFKALADDFSSQQMVELTAAIAFENFSARFNHAFGIESQHLSE